MHFITESLKTLKNRLDPNNKIVIYGEKGVINESICFFNSPAYEDEILQFEKEKNIKLPEDYRLFLKFCNGTKLFQIMIGETNIGGGLELFSLNEIKQHSVNIRLPFLPIGYVSENYVTINVDSIKDNSPNYLFISSFLESRSLNLNVELFIDRYITSQGSNFWDWPIYSAKNFYNS
ncbi:SMI1/KNR4 family protein [Ureibacillus sp. MALMAid1270]|uniref:SMI1/KNR4 family protein n=1 Tax=Ureibacillus sp. MALMAid1270 TaxID=3411629 RepID=UPI003BA4997B